MYELQMLSDSEHHPLQERNATETTYSLTITACRRYSRLVRQRTPGRVAVVCDTEQLTYRQWNERAQINRRTTLDAWNETSAPGLLVGVCLDRSVEMIVAILGVLKAGGAYVSAGPSSIPKTRLTLHGIGRKA